MRRFSVLDFCVLWFALITWNNHFGKLLFFVSFAVILMDYGNIFKKIAEPMHLILQEQLCKLLSGLQKVPLYSKNNIYSGLHET